MNPTVRTWCSQQDSGKLQAGLALAALLMGDDLDTPRSSVPAQRLERFCSDVSCAAPGDWAPPLPARVFDLGQDGIVCTFEDGGAFHVVSTQGDRNRAWRACSSLFVGPEHTGASTGWEERDAAYAVDMARRLPKARLARTQTDWLREPTSLDLAMPSPAHNRPKDLVDAREAVLVDLARLVLGPIRLDLAFFQTDVDGQVEVGTDPMGIGIPHPGRFTFAQEIHDRGALAALCIAAKRLFPGRLGLCRLPHAHLPEHVVQSFARVRAIKVAQPVSAHQRMATLGLIQDNHPELVPFLS